MPPTKPLKKEESEDLFLGFNDIDWSQVSESQWDTQADTQLQTLIETQTQAETQTTLISEPSLTKLAHPSACPPIQTVSVKSESSTQTNDSTKTLVVDDEDVDYIALLEGAENFDWSDWGTEDEDNTTTTSGKLKSPSMSKKFTPVKPKNPKRVTAGAGNSAVMITPPPYTDQCKRCIVVSVTDYNETDHPVKVTDLLCSSLCFPSCRGCMRASGKPLHHPVPS